MQRRLNAEAAAKPSQPRSHFTCTHTRTHTSARRPTTRPACVGFIHRISSGVHSSLPVSQPPPPGGKQASSARLHTVFLPITSNSLYHSMHAWCGPGARVVAMTTMQPAACGGIDCSGLAFKNKASVQASYVGHEATTACSSCSSTGSSSSNLIS